MGKETHCLRILVIEHNRDMLDLLEDEMREIGHDVTKAYRYSSAILEASKGEFDLIIAEVGFPGLTGPEILGCLRKLLPNALIAAMTSFGTERTVQECFREGADYHITKPIQMESLKDFVSCFAKDKMKFQTRKAHSAEVTTGSAGGVIASLSDGESKQGGI